MPVYVCASGATPLVAILIYKGVSPGAALAFLLTGPATNVTTFGILTQLHGRRIALAFGAGIACLAVLAGHVVNAWGPALPGTPLHHAHSSSTGLQEISLAALALMVASSLLRRGSARGSSVSCSLPEEGTSIPETPGTPLPPTEATVAPTRTRRLPRRAATAVPTRMQATPRLPSRNRSVAPTGTSFPPSLSPR